MPMLGGTLARYFGLRFLGTVLLVFLGIFMLIALLDYIELMRRANDIPNVSALLVAKTSLYRVPQITERIMPFCILIGAMSCYLNLSRRLELVVARAAGMSAWQFISPAIIVAFLLGIFATTVYNPISATLQERSKRYEAELFGQNQEGMLSGLGSSGGAWQDGDRFVFASPQGISTVRYLVDLIQSGVAPYAGDTNPPQGGDFVRDQFLQGHVAMFQTGAYNLADVLDDARFGWKIVPIPQGPRGRVSVTNGIVAAANASSPHPEEVAKLLDWLGSAQGQDVIGASGSASPASLTAQGAYRAFWTHKGVDLGPMYQVLDGRTVQAPQGTRYTAATDALQPLLNDVFLGRLPVAAGLRSAQDAANAAMRGG